MSAGYLVVDSDVASVTVVDHTKPKQKNGGHPTMTFFIDNVDPAILAGDRVEIALRPVTP